MLCCFSSILFDGGVRYNVFGVNVLKFYWRLWSLSDIYCDGVCLVLLLFVRREFKTAEHHFAAQFRGITHGEFCFVVVCCVVLV
jgi:hypothetical protein